MSNHRRRFLKHYGVRMLNTRQRIFKLLIDCPDGVPQEAIMALASYPMIYQIRREFLAKQILFIDSYKKKKYWKLEAGATLPRTAPRGRPPNASRKLSPVASSLFELLSSSSKPLPLSVIQRKIKVPYRSLHLAANRLNVVRKTTGFGPDRITRWSLPQ